MPIRKGGSNVTLNGFWALAADHKGNGKRRINDLARTSLYIAMDQFMLDRQNGFQIRFSPTAYDRLQLTRRATETVKQKMRKFNGRDLPYVSIKKNPLGGMHMRELLQRRGVVYNITATSTTTKGAFVTLTLPGANKLNQLKCADADAYRRELIGFRHGAKWQADNILKDALVRFKMALIELSNNYPSKAA
jgi:hypothetical protein